MFSLEPNCIEINHKAISCKVQHVTWFGVKFMRIWKGEVDESEVARFLNVVWWGSKWKHHKDTCIEEIERRLQTSIMTLHSIMNTQLGGPMYLVKKSTTHALPITITKSGEVRYSIRYLQMFHCRFASATRVLLCKSNRKKLENMENMDNNPNNTHLPE